MIKELKLINNNNLNQRIKFLNLCKFLLLIPAIISAYYIIHNIIIGELLSWKNVYLLIIHIPYTTAALIIGIVIIKRKKEMKEPNNAIKHGDKITVELIEIIDHSEIITERNVDLIFKKDNKEYILKNFNDYNFTDEFLEITNDNEFTIYEYENNYYIQEKEILDKMCKELINMHHQPNPFKNT